MNDFISLGQMCKPSSAKSTGSSNVNFWADSKTQSLRTRLLDWANRNTELPVKPEFQIIDNFLLWDITYTKKLFIIGLKLKFNWAFCFLPYLGREIYSWKEAG